MAKTPRVVHVTGFGNSGAGAVMHLLGECEGFHCPPQEFYVLHHPDGLMSLEDSLVRTWDPFGPDYALRRFRDLVKVLARPHTRFQFGLDYHRLFTPRFAELANAFADRISDVRFDGHFMFRRAEMSAPEHFAFLACQRFKLARGSRFFLKRYGTQFVTSGEPFMKEARAFVDELTRAIVEGTGATDLALLQGSLPNHVDRCNGYFESAKAVIIDRDPRDIYLSAQSATYMPRDVGAFIAWFEAARAGAPKKGVHGGAINVSFEDLVLDYDRTVGAIFDFLGVDPARHTKKRTVFKPEQSAKRIAKWKSHPDKAALRRIEAALPGYLSAAAEDAKESRAS